MIPRFLKVLVVLAFFAAVALGHSKYVPESACETMEPHHKRQAQTSDSPFRVVVYADKVHPGKSIFLSLVVESDPSIRSDCNIKHVRKHHHKHKKGFKGFYLQARDSRENRPIGKFTPTEDDTVKVHNCGQGTDNAAFHGVKGHKTNVTIEWTAPQDFQGKVIFTTTFVKKYHTFWTNVKSSPVSVRIPYHTKRLKDHHHHHN